MPRPCLLAALRVAHGGGPISAPRHFNDVPVADRHNHVGDPPSFTGRSSCAGNSGETPRSRATRLNNSNTLCRSAVKEDLYGIALTEKARDHRLTVGTSIFEAEQRPDGERFR